MRIAIINGPNLNLLGTREPEIYGNTGLAEVVEELKQAFPSLELANYQSNVEGEIINLLHEQDQESDGIILNAAGYTHTSVAIGDAVAAIQTPVVEVHLSNVHAREDFRQLSHIAPYAIGVITGFGALSYHLAATYFINQTKSR